MESYWEDNLHTLYSGTRLEISNLKFPSTDKKACFSKDTIIERNQDLVKTYSTLQRQAIIDEATTLRLLCRLRQHASQAKREPSEFLALFADTFYTLSDLEQLEKIHQAKAIAGMVKEEIIWFESLPLTLKAGGKPIDMALVNEFKDKLLSAQINKAQDVFNGYSASEIASVVGNRWLSSDVIDLISSLTNKEAHQNSKITVLSASNIKLTCIAGKLDKFLNKMDICKESKMLIIVCNVGNTNGRNSIQFDNKGYHWALVVMDFEKFEIIYCDSLCKAIPSNLDSIVLPLLKFLEYDKVKFEYKKAHSCSGLGYKHMCSNVCNNYPIQTDGFSCGVITTIFAAFLACCNDQERMYILTPCKGRPLVEYAKKICKSLRDPCDFKTELRCVLISWIAQRKIDMDLVREIHFDVHRNYTITAQFKSKSAAHTESSSLNKGSKATLVKEKTDQVFQGKADTIYRNFAPRSVKREKDETVQEHIAGKERIDIDLVRKNPFGCSETYVITDEFETEKESKAPLTKEETVHIFPCKTDTLYRHLMTENVKKEQTKTVRGHCGENERVSSHSSRELIKIIAKKRKIEKEKGEINFGVNKKYMASLIPCCGREWYANMRKYFDDDETVLETQSYMLEPSSLLLNSKKEEEIGCLDVLSLQASDKWYENQCELENKNSARSKVREENKCIEDSNLQRIAMMRARVSGSLEQNINIVEKKIRSIDNELIKAELSAITEVGKALRTFPIMLNQDAARIYEETKMKHLKRSADATARKEAGSFYESLSKHLNIMQIYVSRKAFLVANIGDDVHTALERIDQVCKARDKKAEIKDHIKSKIGETLNSCLEYMDSKRDQDVLKYVLSNITSVKAAADIIGVKNRDGIKRSEAVVKTNLGKFKEIKADIERKYENLSDEKRKALIRRAIDACKIKELRHTFIGNKGRKLKAMEFPDLGAFLEFQFGEGSRVIGGGGGLESHPKLKNEIMYKAEGNKTKMKDAREILLAAAGPGFRISLSTCYNYTMNYKRGTSQAKRHHHGQGVNANISLHKAPDTKAIKDNVINAHWCSANVNYFLDAACDNKGKYLVDSKDAKAVVRAGEKQGGKTWKVIELKDHSYQDESRKHAVTPMAHLFVSTEIVNSIDRPIDTLASGEVGIMMGDAKQERLLTIKRTGKGVFLINLSFYEPETVYRAVNEIYHLMAIPAMDTYFRIGVDGGLPENMVFVVDNGSSEKPRSPLVRMSLVRMCKYLKRTTVTQVSFAEYYSKRNMAERLNAAAHTGLQSQAVFGESISSTPGSLQHHQDMEAMAKGVATAITQQTFAGHPILVFRGVKNDFVFNDEKDLQEFLKLSEDRKLISQQEYKAEKNETSRVLNVVYGLSDEYKSSYRVDYEILENKAEGVRTAWCDKYTTTIYNPEVSEKPFINLQPIPDYVRWFRTNGELHYMSYESRKDAQSEILQKVPELFLPTVILHNAALLFRDINDEIIRSLSLLCWCPENAVRKHLETQKVKEAEKYEATLKQAMWCNHRLYKEYSVKDLREMCKESDLQTEGAKHDLVCQIAESENEQAPQWSIYTGDLSKIPSELKHIMRLSCGKLKEIIKFHGYCTDEKKEVLAMRVFSLRTAETHNMYQREINEMLNLLEICQNLIIEQKMLYDSTLVSVYRQRAFSKERIIGTEERPREAAGLPEQKLESKTESRCCSSLDGNVFKVLREELLFTKKKLRTCADNVALFANVGMHILVYWPDDKIRGWDAGWYSAKIVSVHFKARITGITVTYRSEPDSCYEIDVKSALAEQIIAIGKNFDDNENQDVFSEAIEVGAIIEIKISKKVAKKYSIKEEWAEATVQSYCPEEDVITAVFTENPAEAFSTNLSPLISQGKVNIIEAVF